MFGFTTPWSRRSSDDRPVGRSREEVLAQLRADGRSEKEIQEIDALTDWDGMKEDGVPSGRNVRALLYGAGEPRGQKLDGVDEDDGDEGEDPFGEPHREFSRLFPAVVAAYPKADGPLESDEAFMVADDWGERLRSGEAVTLRGLLLEDGSEAEELDAVAAGQTDEPDLLDWVIVAGLVILWFTGSLDREGLDLMEKALALRAHEELEDDHLHTVARELAAFRQATGL